MNSVVGIYHKDCVDGTTAAAVLLKKFPHARLFPLGHAYVPDEVSSIIDESSPGDRIYTLDCVLGAEEFLKAGYAVTTIDHHIGAVEFLGRLKQEYPGYSYVFDNEKSGASLAWSHFFPREKEAELIRYVEDVDLWKWQYGNVAKDITNYLSIFRNDPRAVLELCEGDLGSVKEKGHVISLYVDREVKNLAALPPVGMSIEMHSVPAFNVTTHESAVGNALSRALNKAVALFTIKGDKVKITFRSMDEHDPSSLALSQLLGGGGHRNAAGATISLASFLKMLDAGPRA